MQSNKGFTLIELMIVVAVIGILSAVAVPNFIGFLNKENAVEYIVKGMKISQVDNIEVRKVMTKILKAPQKYEEQINRKIKSLIGSDETVTVFFHDLIEIKPETNNTVPVVLKEVEVPQSGINTAPAVLNKPPKQFTKIQCGGDGLIKGCTLLFRQGKDKFIIPMACELTDSNAYVCEVR